MTWVIGDITNLASIYLLNQLVTQKILATFWMTVDSILMLSHFYFNNTKRQLKKYSLHFRKYEPLVYFTIFVVAMDVLVAIGVNGMYEMKYNEHMYDICSSET